jgi:hypothetical protein
MIKKCILLLSILITQPAFAVVINIDQVDSSKFIELYRKFFEKEIVADLSATRAELNAVFDKRNMILDYMNNNNQKITDDEMNKAWQIYIKKNFKTIDEFASYLEKCFIKEFELKERFRQNLYFSKYFNEIISPRIKNDFDTRKKIFEIAEAEQIDIPDNDFQEGLYQMAENWGGMDHFNAFLSKNNISLMDISFYIKSEKLKNKILDKYIEQKLKNDTELAQSIENSALNEYNILNQRHKPLYFFRHAYISKEIPKADEKIEEYFKQIQKNENPKLEKINTSEVIVEDMDIFVDPNSDLIAHIIKKNIIELSDDGLFVNKKLSPIISKDSFYHIFQLTTIIVPENEDLAGIKERKIRELRNTPDELLSLIFQKNANSQTP